MAKTAIKPAAKRPAKKVAAKKKPTDKDLSITERATIAIAESCNAISVALRGQKQVTNRFVDVRFSFDVPLTDTDEYLSPKVGVICEAKIDLRKLPSTGN